MLAAEPVPTRALKGSKARREPAKAVPMEPAAVRTVPNTMRGLRPYTSHAWPIFIFNSTLSERESEQEARWG